MRVVITVKFVPEPNDLLLKSECDEFRSLVEQAAARNGFDREVELRWMYTNGRGGVETDISAPIEAIVKPANAVAPC